MLHETALIATIATGLGLAFLFGLLTSRLHLPPILGYLLAGVAVGPFTPGFVANTALAPQLAELGVILLMFGVGLHFSITDLLSVRRIAVPGAIAQIIAAAILGAFVAWLWGWSWGSGLVFGLSLSVASTVVLLRSLEDRGALDSVDGRIAVGWLIVEDLVTVLVLVLLPLFSKVLGDLAQENANTAGFSGIFGIDFMKILGLMLLKMATFGILMFAVGRRVVPWLLGNVVKTGSRELFTLAVLAIALGIAVGAATLFGVSIALGAFFAGVIVNESDFSHEAASNALPLQDAFAVLFFVSVGMLFDPRILIQQPLDVIAVVLIILVGKSLASFLIVLAFGYPLHTALTISASLAQIGEFSFILVALAISLGLLPKEAQSLIVAGAMISITINPFIFRSLAPVERWIRRWRGLASALERPAGALAQLLPSVDAGRLHDHVVLIGYGRVGASVVEELALHNIPYVIIEQSRERIEALREIGLPVIFGDATRPEVLGDAHLERARLVLVSTPDAYHSRAILALAKRLNPAIDVVIRTHSDEERMFLESNGAVRALVEEREMAISLTRHALRRFGVIHDMEAVAARALK